MNNVVEEITIDYDYCDLDEWLLNYFSKFPLNYDGSNFIFNIKSIYYRKSCTKGIHIKIKLYEPVSFDESISARKFLGDDHKRIIYDKRRYMIGARTGILFDYKIMQDGTKKRAGKWRLLCTMKTKQ